MLICQKPHGNNNFVGFLLFLFLLLPMQANAADVCVVIDKGFKAIHGREGRSRRMQVEPGEIYPFLGTSKSGASIKSRIGGQPFWLKADSVTRKTGENCNQLQVPGSGLNVKKNESSDEKTSEKAVTSQGWTFGFEVGYRLTHSPDSAANIITPVPGPTVDVNDDSFDSPFIDSVGAGSGIDFSVFAEMPLFGSFRLKTLLGYSQKTIQYVSRSNPANPNQSFVTYNQLTPTDQELDFQSLHLTLMPKYGFHLFSVPIDFGVGFGFHYYLEETFVEFRTAPQKLSAYYVQTGYEQFEIELVPRLEVQFSLIYVYTQFHNRLTGSNFFMDPQIGVGLEF